MERIKYYDDMPLMVNLSGKVLFNIDGILAALLSKKIFEYPNMVEGRMTLMREDYNKGSLLYHSLGEMIQYAQSDDGIWFHNRWNNPKWGNPIEINQVVDSLFIDEFNFLKGEGLIQYEEISIRSMNEICGYIK